MTNNTQDTELFELCKQVYESTGWDDDSLRHWLGGNIHQKRLFESDIYLNNTTEDTYVPLYNSDYLLEKFEGFGFMDGASQGLVIEHVLYKGNGIYGWKCHFPGYYYKYGDDEWVGFDRVIAKALLKLTLALHKEGLL